MHGAREEQAQGDKRRLDGLPWGAEGHTKGTAWKRIRQGDSADTHEVLVGPRWARNIKSSAAIPWERCSKYQSWVLLVATATALLSTIASSRRARWSLVFFPSLLRHCLYTSLPSFITPTFSAFPHSLSAPATRPTSLTLLARVCLHFFRRPSAHIHLLVTGVTLVNESWSWINSSGPHWMI